jgi:hypothetical protein
VTINSCPASTSSLNASATSLVGIGVSSTFTPVFAPKPVGVVSVGAASGHTGALVGGVVGALIVLVLVVGVVYYFTRYRKRPTSPVPLETPAYTPVEVEASVEVYHDELAPAQESSVLGSSTSTAASGSSKTTS